MRPHFLVFVIGFLLMNTAIAQPGYKGKKLIIQYQPNFNANFMGITKDGSEKILIPDAIYHGGYVEYVVGRRTTLGGRFSYCKNHVNMAEAVDIHYYSNPSTQLVYSQLQDRKIEFLVKHFRGKRGNLAPYGAYTQVGLAKHWFDVTDGLFDEVLYANSNIYAFSLAFGKQRVYHDFLVLDLNLKLGLTLPFNNPSVSSNGHSEAIVARTNTYVGVQNIIGLTIGIGYLAPKLGK